MDGSLERGTKVSLSVLQLLTGIPFYTITSDFEKTYEELKEGIDAFLKWMDKTPEEWQAIVDNAFNRVSSQVEDMQALTEEVAELSPEEWAVICQDTLDVMSQYAEAEIRHLFSEEGMSEFSYSV